LKTLTSPEEKTVLMKYPRGQEYSSQVQGFTIIEVVVAVFIISVTIVGGVMGFSNGLALVADLRERATADRIAGETMEELRGGVSLPNSETTSTEGTYTVTTDPQAVESALTKITVTVTWTSHRGNSRSRSLVTYFTENGISKN